MSTRRTYILLSEALRESQPGFTTLAEGGVLNDRKRGWLAATNAIADALARQSTAFDRERFLKDAGVTS